MSGKSIKLNRKAVRKESSKIKCEGLEEFLIYSNLKPWYKRLVFAWKIIFKLTV
jgi:hypothetical protein